MCDGWQCAVRCTVAHRLGLGGAMRPRAPGPTLSNGAPTAHLPEHPEPARTRREGEHMEVEFDKPARPDGLVPAVCPEALNRLWQAAYGTAERAEDQWLPFDADRPLMALLRACTGHMANAQLDGATHAHLLARLLLLSVWLCSDEARSEPGRLTAWTRHGRSWQLCAVHRDLLESAASCTRLGALPHPRST